jgi:hypothetical protein
MPSLITASVRYFDVGTTKIYYAPTIANTASVTRAELNAATDLSREVADIDGCPTSRPDSLRRSRAGSRRRTPR